MATSAGASGTATPLGLSRIGQIAIVVRDIDRAIGFYRDRLGLRFLFQAGTLGFFQCGETRLMLSLPEGEFTHASSILYFAVQDIETVHRALVERGVEFRDEPHIVHRADTYDLWLASFRDTEGNTHALMEEKRH